MPPRSMNLWALLAVVFMLTACASEDWDNPKDPSSPAFREACYGLTTAEKATCVFWEAFDHGLSRWQVGPSPFGVKPIRILPAPAGVSVTTVLALPGCPTAGRPGMQIEVVLPNHSTELSVIWMAAPESDGQLSIGINGAPSQIPSSEDAEGEFEGWQKTSAVLDAFAGKTIVLSFVNVGEEGATCGDQGVLVALVLIRKLAE